MEVHVYERILKVEINEDCITMPSYYCKLHYFVFVGTATQSFGQGRGPIFRKFVRCSGFEESLLDCDQNYLRQFTCGHWYDVGVICQGKM